MPNQPLIDTPFTPEEIIGYDNLSSLAAHIKGYSSANKYNPQMGEILNRLRENGFYPNGFMANGKIFFATALKSKQQQIFEGPELERIKKLPLSEIMAEGRSGFRKIMNSMVDPFKVEPWAADAESFENQEAN